MKRDRIEKEAEDMILQAKPEEQRRMILELISMAPSSALEQWLVIVLRHPVGDRRYV